MLLDTKSTSRASPAGPSARTSKAAPGGMVKSSPCGSKINVTPVLRRFRTTSVYLCLAGTASEFIGIPSPSANYTLQGGLARGMVASRVERIGIRAYPSRPNQGHFRSQIMAVRQPTGIGSKPQRGEIAPEFPFLSPATEAGCAQGPRQAGPTNADR
jgi:hypothetical protein